MLPWMYNFAFSETYTKQINLYRLHHQYLSSISELQPNINNEVSYSRGLIHNWYFNFKKSQFYWNRPQITQNDKIQFEMRWKQTTHAY